MTFMEPNETTKLTSHLHKNYSSKSHHLYERTISRVVSTQTFYNYLQMAQYKLNIQTH